MLSTTKLKALLAGLSCSISVAAFGQEERPLWVQWATYIGSFGRDGAFGIGADAEGNVYVGGRTDSADLLVNAGFEDLPDFAGGDDAVVFKLAPDGSEVLEAASFGGPGFEAIYGVEVADDGSVIVIGKASPGFEEPVETCHIGQGGGPVDCFVARLDNKLEVVSFVVFGGAGIDSAIDVDVSADGVVSVLGATSSRDLPTTRGALHEEYLGGESDLFVARLRLDSELACEERAAYVTYLGSSGSEDDPNFTLNFGIHATDDGVVTVAGGTRSGATFPLRAGGIRLASSDIDVFVQRIRCDAELPRSEQDLYSAVVGGSASEKPKWVGVTNEGIIQVVGWSFSADFPTTDGSRFGGINDVFILEINPDPALPEIQQLLVSTRFGGSGYDATGDAASRPDGTIFVGGQSEEFPISCGALAGFVRGQGRASLAEWRRDAENPGTGTIGLSTALSLGGCGDTCDRAYQLAFAPDGTLLVCGTLFGSFPFDAAGAAQPFRGGGADMFVLRLDVRTPRADFSTDVSRREDFQTDLALCLEDTSETPEGTQIVSRRWALTGTPPGWEDHALEVCAAFESPGTYEATLEVTNDVGHCDRRSKKFTVDFPLFHRGDCNGDGSVDIADAVSTLDSLFLGDGSSACDDACDSNDDGSVNISDAVATLGILFLGQGRIPPPGVSECGMDPTLDALGCANFRGC